MLPGMERGPKPTKWVSGAKVNFEAFFARRSEPFRAAPDESPLIEVTAVGEGWMFSGFGDESTQVRSTVGGSIRNIVVDITGTMVMLGSGQDPGQGSCQRYAVLNEVEVPEGTPFAQSRVRGGTGDLQLRLASGEIVWYSSRHCCPWVPSDVHANHPWAHPALRA